MMSPHRRSDVCSRCLESDGSLSISSCWIRQGLWSTSRTSTGITALSYITWFRVSAINGNLYWHTAGCLCWNDSESKWKHRSGCCWTVWRMWINVKDLHPTSLWDFKLIYSILCSWVPSQHERASAACSHARVWHVQLQLPACLRRCPVHLKNRQIVMTLCPTRHSGETAACKALNRHCICSAQRKTSAKVTY